MLSLWLRFFDKTLFSNYLSCLQHHVHARHSRDYDEQKAVAMVKRHYQGCQKQNVLYTKVSQRFR